MPLKGVGSPRTERGKQEVNLAACRNGTGTMIHPDTIAICFEQVYKLLKRRQETF